MIIQVLSREIKNKSVFSSMHNLRWHVFVDRLKWKDGLVNVNFMEFDEYDNEHAVYLVGLSDSDEVTATARLMPTNKPYMIKEHYPDYIYDEACPEDPHILEITRFCFSAGSSGHAVLKPAACLAAACIEYGLVYGIDYYIALTNLSVKKLMARVGWNPQSIGEQKITPDNLPSVVCEYAVNEELLHIIKQKHGISGDTLYDSEKPSVSLMEKFRNSKVQSQANIVFPLSNPEQEAEPLMHGSPLSEYSKKQIIPTF